MSSILHQFDPSVYLSLALLFGIASQFRAMDGYSLLRRITARFEARIGMLFAVAAVTCIFSPLILNDVVVLILTPVIVMYAKESRSDVAPLVVAEITFTNIASSLTPLGNPQNILLWTASKVTFLQFVAGTAFPLALSGCVGVLALLPLARNPGRGAGPPPDPEAPAAPGIYLVLVIAAIIFSDFFQLPVYIALGAGFVLGFAFTSGATRRVVKEYDLRSLLVLYAFVASTTALSVLLAPVFGPRAAPVAEGSQPYSALFMAVVSGLISNVPATQLVLSVTTVASHVAPKLAVEAGLAGNIDPISSFANILALLMVRRAGLPIRRAIALQFIIGAVVFIPALL